MKLSQRAKAVEPFFAMSFGAQAAALEAQGHDVVKLSIGEPSFGAPEAVRAAMREAMDGRPHPYTVAMGRPDLREAIAGFYADRHGVQLDPARIAITAGASAALMLVLAATTDPGDEVVMADPSYPCNRQMVAAFGGRVAAVPTTAQTRYQLDVAGVEKAWSTRTSAVMIATPSNPTGTSIPFAELVAVSELARDRGAWRIVDEIYLNLADPAPDGTPARTILGADPHAVVINSFSKYFGMTGWRLGWCVLPPGLAQAVERMEMNYYICASAPAQEAALACFAPEVIAECDDRRLELLARREIVLDGLTRIGLPVPVPPDGAFYVYFDVTGTGLDSWEFCRRALQEAHVALTPGRDFGAGTADTHVRLSYAPSRAELTEGIERLGAFVAGLDRP